MRSKSRATPTVSIGFLTVAGAHGTAVSSSFSQTELGDITVLDTALTDTPAEHRAALEAEAGKITINRMQLDACARDCVLIGGPELETEAARGREHRTPG